MSLCLCIQRHVCLQLQTITAASWPILHSARQKGAVIVWPLSIIWIDCVVVSVFVCLCLYLCLQTQTITATSYPILGHARAKGALIARASSLIQTPP